MVYIKVKTNSLLTKTYRMVYNKIIMDRRSNMGSSVYTSDYSQKQSLNLDQKVKTKPRIKIQIVNQNLEEAIRDVRNNVKENPQWSINVKKISEQYKPNKQRASIINETQQQQFAGNFLPQSSKQPPMGSQFQNNHRLDLQKLKYTERQKRQYQKRMLQIKEKRMQLEVNSIQKQMRAKLQRKIKQNILLKEKAKIAHEIQQQRQKRMRLRDKMSIRKNEEQSLLHQSNIANVQMMRRYKNKLKKRQLSESHTKSEQSAVQIKFKQFLNQQQKTEKRDILVARYRALRTASQGSLRKKMLQKREVQTSQSSKRFFKMKTSDVMM